MLLYLRRRASIQYKLLSHIGWKRIAQTFLTVFGGLWLFVESIGFFLPDLFPKEWNSLLILFSASACSAILLRFPKQSFSVQLSGSDVTIEVRVGDLFDEKAHLVIGTNDVFDTELGEVINRRSVQGQFAERVYLGDTKKLDQEINNALTNLSLKAKVDTAKKLGKNSRYPIGTTIVLRSDSRHYFLVAYCNMDKDCIASSNADDIWKALSELWKQVRDKGQELGLAIPIIGSGLARTNIKRQILAEIIVLSFLVAARRQHITQKLILVIHPSDLKDLNIYDFHDYLKSITR